MKHRQGPLRVRVAVWLAMGLSSSCLGPGGHTVEEERASALEMRDEALAVLYAHDPELEQEVERSMGYGVFSIFSIHPGLLSFARGYGVITNTATGKTTHAWWTRLTLGPGIALKRLYGLALFRDAGTLEKFEEGCWTFGGQLEASLVLGDFGGSFAETWALGRDLGLHSVTYTGVALEIELVGLGRVSNASELNRSATPDATPPPLTTPDPSPLP